MMMRISVFALLFAFFCGSANAQSKWTLQECIDYALQNNITVMQSRLNVERADINYDQNRYSLLPNLNAGASHGYNWGQRIDPFTNQFASQRVQTNNLFIATSFDVFNGFSKVNSMKQSREEYMASQYDLERIRNDISLQICLAYLQILLNQEGVKLSQNQIEVTREQVQRMEIMVEAGQVPRGNLFDLQSQMAQEELNLVTAENAVTLTLLNLTQLLQLSREDAAEFDIVMPDLSDDGGEMISMAAYDIYLRAKQSMPQMLAADYRRRSAAYGLEAARGQFMPSLSFSAAVGSGYSGANNERIGTGTSLGFIPIGQVVGTGQTVVSLQEQTIFSEGDFRTKRFGDQLSDNLNQNLSFNLSIPIFNGASVRSSVRRAKLNQLDADLNYSQVSNQLRFEIEQAYADAKAAMNTFVANRKAVAALEESFNYAQVRYEQKVINAVDYNLTKTQYNNAQIGELRAKYDFIFRTKILDFYLGNPITL